MSRDKEGNAFIYRAAMTKEDYHRRIVDETVGQLLTGSADSILTAFVDLVATDEANLNRLERLIAAKKKAEK